MPGRAEDAEPDTTESTETAETAQENSPVILQQETPELAAQDPQAPPEETDAAENDLSGRTPEGSMLLTDEQIRKALDEGALDEAEAQCIDLSDENGFFSWLWNWLFGKKDNQEEYTGWLTKNGKTYYYSASTHKPVTGVNLDKPEAQAIIDGYISNLKPAVFELVFSKDSEETLRLIKRVRDSGAKVFVNAMWPELCGGHDDDKAVEEQKYEQSWGWILEQNIGLIQTDRPCELLHYLKKKNLHP